MRFVTNFPGSLEFAIAKAKEPREFLSTDCETVSLDNRLILGVAVGVSPTEGFYFFNPVDELLAEMLSSAEIVYCHNAKFDVPELAKRGHHIRYYHDTQVMAYSAGIMDKSLEDLSASLLGRACPSVTDQWKKSDQGNIGINHVKMAGISIIHACNTYALATILPKTELYLEVDRPMIDLVIEMEQNGVLVDQVRTTELEQSVVVRAEALESQLRSILGNEINLNSSVQVVTAFQQLGIIGTRKTQSGRQSVSDESLRPLHNPTADNLLRWRSEMKTITTYLPAFRNPDPQGRIHTSFGLTNTGRYSSKGPNLQNLTTDKMFKELEVEEA